MVGRNDNTQSSSDPRSIPILERLDQGESTEALLPELYQELRALARHYMQNERASHTLQPTALVHEAYLRLLGDHAAQARTRLQFLAASARAMRQVLIEHARARNRKKRGGKQTRVPLQEQHLASDDAIDDLLAVGNAIEELAQQNPRHARVVELLYFGGLTASEAAEVLGIASRTVERDWRAARQWLANRVLGPNRLELPPRPSDAATTTGARPERIGRYEVQDELGRGSGGIVYRAHDDELGRDIALKILPDAASGSWTDRLRQEARALAALNHPNIAMVHSLERDRDRVFVTMELVPGHTLEKLLRAGALPLQFCVDLTRQIASALEAARKQGVVHCDLSPANVKIGPDGVAKVLDFGLARTRASRAVEANLGGIAGTPGYMSPEQIRGDEPDFRTDVWALGCLFFECLTGAAAFPGDVPAQRLIAARERDPDWSALPASLPPRLRALLMRCLEKDPDSRLNSVRLARRELGEALVRFRSATVASRANVGGRTTPGTRANARGEHNVPSPRDALIGRRSEVLQVIALLQDARLVTLVGAGGCGKSRLAIEVCWKLAPQVPSIRFIDVASCTDLEQVVRALALALGVQEHADRNVLDSIDDAIAGEAIFLFDGCEHLLDPLAGLLDRLQRTHADLRTLATSRERFRLPGESLFEVKPLSLPSGPTRPEVLKSHAAKLFLERAREMSPRFAETDRALRAVADICTHLDGIPLAIELAAARVRSVPVEEIANRLDDRFRLLTSGRRTAQPRHRTLRAMVDWSHALLSHEEQLLFRRLSIFRGSFALSAVESICASNGIEDWQILDLLSALLDKSLVEAERAETGDSARYRLLETIAHYARERLEESGEIDALRRSHLEHFRQWAVDRAPDLKGPHVVEVLDELEHDHANLIQALESALSLGKIEEGLQLVSALEIFWTTRSGWREGYRYATELLERAELDTPATGHALAFVATWHFYRQDLDRAQEGYDRARAIAARLGDERLEARTLRNLGGIALNRNALDLARELSTRAIELERRLGDSHGVAIGLNNLGLIAHRSDRIEEAGRLYGESLALLRELGDERVLPSLLENHGMILLREGRFDEALAEIEESIQLRRKLGDPRGLAISLSKLGLTYCTRQEVRRGMDRYHEALESFAATNDAHGYARCILYVGAALIECERVESAARVLGALQRWLHAHTDPQNWETKDLDAVRQKIESRLEPSLFHAAWNSELSDSLEHAGAAAQAAIVEFRQSG